MAVIVRIKKNSTKKEIQKKLASISEASTKKGFNAKKFTGSIVSFGDGIAYQKNIRNEWD